MDNKAVTKGLVVIWFSLTVIFTALKLLGIISWQWLWVLSPVWVSLCFILFSFTIIIILEIYDEIY